MIKLSIIIYYVLFCFVNTDRYYNHKLINTIVKSYMSNFDNYSNLHHTMLNILDVIYILVYIYRNHLSRKFYQAKDFRFVYNLLS